jgi:hypothetical protein
MFHPRVVQRVHGLSLTFISYLLYRADEMVNRFGVASFALSLLTVVVYGSSQIMALILSPVWTSVSSPSSTTTARSSDRVARSNADKSKAASQTRQELSAPETVRRAVRESILRA